MNIKISSVLMFPRNTLVNSHSLSLSLRSIYYNYGWQNLEIRKKKTYVIQEITSATVFAFSCDAIRNITQWSFVTRHTRTREIISSRLVNDISTNRAVPAWIIFAPDQSKVFAEITSKLVGALTPEGAR